MTCLFFLAGALFTYTLNYLPDVARGLVTLGERNEALGEVWHLPGAEPLTGRQFIEMVFQELGRSPKVRVIPVQCYCSSTSSRH